MFSKPHYIGYHVFTFVHSSFHIVVLSFNNFVIKQFDSALTKFHKIQLILYAHIIIVFQQSGQIFIIMVAESDIFPLCYFQCCISCITDSSIFLMNHHNTFILTRIFITPFRATISGTVIHQNQFKLFQTLIKNTFNSCIQIFTGIINRHDYRYFNHISHISLSKHEKCLETSFYSYSIGSSHIYL